MKKHCLVQNKWNAKERCEHFSCHFANGYFALIEFKKHWKSLGQFRWYAIALVVTVAMIVSQQYQIWGLREEMSQELAKILDYLAGVKR